MKIKKILIIMLLIFLSVSCKVLAVEETNNTTTEEQSDIAQIENIYPTIEIQSIKANPGDEVEMDIYLKSINIIEQGGFTISFNNKLENVECVAGDKFLLESSLNKESGKVGISFVLKEVPEYVTSQDDIVCKLKFKIPKNFKVKDGSNIISVESVDTLYSNNMLQVEYYTVDGVIEINKSSNNVTKIIIIAGSCIVIIILIALIISKKKK